MKSLEYSSVPLEEGYANESQQARRRRSHYRWTTKWTVASVIAVISIVIFGWTYRSKMNGTGITIDREDNKSENLSANVMSSADEISLNQSEEEPPRNSSLSPSLSPSSPPPVSVSSCDYECSPLNKKRKTERLGHNTPLYKGQAICNHDQRLGISHEGVFQLHDCLSDTVQVFFNASSWVSSPTSMLYFEMSEAATFQIWVRSNKTDEEENDPVVIWEEPTVRTTMQVTPQCLSPPLLDCPYLHLRKGGMLVVLNWINSETNEWMDRDIRRCYKHLFDD